MSPVTTWPDGDLCRIAATDDLHIAPFREDGVTPGTFTWIWSVVVDGGLYVRAYNGQRSRWYRAAIRHGAGRIRAAGRVWDVAFTPADILKYDPATGWSMYFDGSDVGITKNLAAFEVLNNGRILMSFAANQPTPAGTFAPQDIARFTPSSTGPNTAGSFQWAFDGSANLLTTTGEKIDALGDIGDGRVALSTTGAAAVKLPNGVVLKAQDEDALGLIPNTGAWSAYFDGTAIKGLPVEDVNALWVDPATGDLYVSIIGAFNLGGVRGNGKDIVKLTKTPGAPGGYVPSLWWDGSAEGFPVAIDGLEIVP